MSYLVWKLFHVVSVIVFLGNITTGLFWAAHANKTRDYRLIGATFKGIVRSDRLFTIPGVVGIVVAGVAMAVEANIPILSTGWILWPVVLFVISGIAFGIWVAPLQGRIVKLVEDASVDDSWETYCRLYRRWELWGLVALLTTVAALVIMVLKPSLPGL